MGNLNYYCSVCGNSIRGNVIIYHKKDGGRVELCSDGDCSELCKQYDN